MKYLLDTNTCIQYLNRRSESLIEQMQRIAPAGLGTSLTG
jgi:predicted nucleic acid-binding protein